MRIGRAGGPADIVVETRGEVVESAREYVRGQLAALDRRLPHGVTQARLKLTAFTRPSAPVPALVQANLTVAGVAVRAQVAAAFLPEAGRLVRRRLREHLERLAGAGGARPWHGATAARWWSQQPATPRIVRHKSYQLTRCHPGEAARTMDVMDYDFHLFVDDETGEDSIVFRIGPTGYRLARLRSLAPPTAPVDVPLTVNVHPVPGETTETAATWLSTCTDLPFRFFKDTETGRGTVLYRRYDGDYGLLRGR